MTTKAAFRVAVLTHGNCLEFLRYATRATNFQVTDVFLETVQNKERGIKEKLTRSIKYDGWSATAGKFFRRNEYYSSETHADELSDVCRKNGINLVPVEKFNSKKFRERLKSVQADLGVIYGTNILKRSVFEIPKLGSLNIHRGKVPYYRGGPPVFWELFNNEKEIGITAHFVETAVDSGEIVVQKTMPLEYDYASYGTEIDSFLEDFDKLMAEPAAKSMYEAVELVASGNAKTTPPDLTKGKRYRIPTHKQKKELIRRIINRVN